MIAGALEVAGPDDDDRNDAGARPPSRSGRTRAVRFGERRDGSKPGIIRHLRGGELSENQLAAHANCATGDAPGLSG
jgi:hypothetical protein